MSITLQHVREASDVIRGSVMDTPCLLSRTLSDITGAEIYLKFENLQFTASFKDRGALNKLLSLSVEQRKAGVVAASAGNHAQGVAYHAKRLDIPAVIVMPRHTPNVKVENTRAFGAEIELIGENFDEAGNHAVELAARRGLQLIHAYDDEKIIAGQGTVALDMLAAQPDLDILVVPIGGGGLIAGMAVAAKGIKPQIEIIGVEAERFPSMSCAVHGKQAVFGLSTIAEGIAVKAPGKLTVPIVRELVNDIVLVDEGDIEQAIVMLLEIEKTVVEGAGAAALAAVLKHRTRYQGKKTGLVLSGGNIDPLMLASIIERGMARSGRLTRLSVEIRDLPGALAKVSACLAQANTNIVEVSHQRTFTLLPAQTAILEFVIQTRNHAHIAEIIAALRAAGFEARQRDSA
jgi:threonine dehydratase